MASAEDKTERQPHGASNQSSSGRRRKYLPARSGLCASTWRTDADGASFNSQSEAPSDRCKYLQRRSSPQLRTRQSGFSLIEVVVAMGIFLFGALAIVRIFPGATHVIQVSEQRNVAQRMNQTSLALYSSAPASVPEAIIDVHPDTSIYDKETNETGWSDFSGAVSGSATRNASLPSNPPAPDDISLDNSQPASTQLTASAAGRFRRVVGEVHTVEREYSGITERGVITLRYPYIQPAASTPDEVKAVHQPLLYKNIAITGVTINSTGALDFSDATLNNSAANDTSPGGDPRRVSTTLRIVSPDPFPQRQPVTFYVSYRWHIGSGPVNGVVDEPKRFPINASWTGTLPPAPQGPPAQVLAARLNSMTPGFGTTGFAIADGPVQVRMRQLEPGPLTPQDELDRNLGRIIVNPNLIGQQLSVDYSVPDWRTIVHDDNLSTKLSSSTDASTDDQSFLRDLGYTFAPTASPNVVDGRVTTVPTKFILDEPISGNATPASRPSQVYTLIKGTKMIPLTPPKSGVVAASAQWSPDKFTTLSNVDYGMTTPAASAPRALGVRPKSGQVFFDVSGLAAPATRVVYRNLDGWLEQPSVAARSYVPFLDRTPITATERLYWPREPWREYFYEQTLGSASGASPKKGIVLRAADAAQTFLVTYTFRNTANPMGRLMRDVPVTAQAELDDTAPLTFIPTNFLGKFREGSTTNTASAVTLLYLPDETGAKMGLPDNESGAQDKTGYVTSILSIKGASIRVRSAWFDGGRYSQNDVSGYRSLDVESANRS